MVLLTSIISSTIIIIFLLSLYYIHNNRHLNNKDIYLIHKHILDNVCEIYKKSIFHPELEKLQRSHNLDSSSQLNAIKAFKTAEEKLLKKSSIEIYKQLTDENLNCLLLYYSRDTLLMIIIDNLRS